MIVPDEVSIPDRRSLTRLFPALRLVGAIRQAFDLRKLIIAALGLVLLQPGWSLLDRLVPAAADTTPDLFAPSVSVKSVSEPDFWSWETVSGLHFRLSEPVRLLATPLFAFVEPGSGWGRMLHCAFEPDLADRRLGNLRRCDLPDRDRASRQCGRPGSSTPSGLRCQSAGPLILAPLCPLLGLAFCALLGAAFGLLYRLPVVGPALAGIGLILPLAAGLVMTLFLAGLAGRLAALAGGDGRRSRRRARRPEPHLRLRKPTPRLLRRAGRTGLAGGNAGIGSRRPAHIGRDPPDALEPRPDRPDRCDGVFLRLAGTSPSGTIAGATHAFWLGWCACSRTAGSISFFWTAAAYLYLWLRQDVDGTSLDRDRAHPVLIPAHPADDGLIRQPTARSRNPPRRRCRSRGRSDSRRRSYGSSSSRSGGR